MTTRVPVLMRLGSQGDIPLITNSWLTSFRDGPAVQSCPNRLYFANQHKIMEALIPRSTIIVCCNEEDHDQILGWACFEKQERAIVLHYLYVKNHFRRLGLAKQIMDILLDSEDVSTVFYTHRTPVVDRIRLDRTRWIYNPFLVWRMHDGPSQRPILAASSEPPGAVRGGSAAGGSELHSEPAAADPGGGQPSPAPGGGRDGGGSGDNAPGRDSPAE